MLRLTKTILSAFAGFILVACASAPSAPEELIAARSAIDAMNSDPLVMRFEEEAERASAELAMAEQLFTGRSDLSIVKHRAYLASQYAALVETQADNARVRTRVGKAEQERQALQLQAREASVARAEAEAAASRREAEQAMRNAEQQETRASEAIADAAELSRELDELKAQQTERGLVLTLADVLFDTGMSELKPGASRAMDKLASYLEQSGSTSIVIEGHTDSRGAESMNQTLSYRRAASVRTALLSRGVAADRISAEGKGEAFPVASNDTPEGRQQNRRVEIIISSE